jgi:hypothetical protein
MTGGGSFSQLKAVDHQSPNDINAITKKAGKLRRLTQNNLAGIQRDLTMGFGASIMLKFGALHAIKSR